MRNARSLPLLLLSLAVLPAWAASGPDPSGERSEQAVQAADEAEAGTTVTGTDTDSASSGDEDHRSRLHGTGSRVGFRHDTRARGPLANKFGGKQTTRQRVEPEVEPRPTEWREDSVGGRREREVRFRREGDERP